MLQGEVERFIDVGKHCLGVALIGARPDAPVGTRHDRFDPRCNENSARVYLEEQLYGTGAPVEDFRQVAQRLGEQVGKLVGLGGKLLDVPVNHQQLMLFAVVGDHPRPSLSKPISRYLSCGMRIKTNRSA